MVSHGESSGEVSVRQYSGSATTNCRCGGVASVSITVSEPGVHRPGSPCRKCGMILWMYVTVS
jgi:hypothetical protein